MKRFKGKSVLVTGAGGGIGRGISLRLAEEGADIAACDIKEEELKETLKKIEETGQKVWGLCVTLRKKMKLREPLKRL